MDRIPLTEIRFQPSSFQDPGGRLFWWKQELYRAITTERASLYRGLFQTGIARGLTEKGLVVETEITPFELDGYDLVLKHRSVPFVSYCYEWCPDMLRDAALKVIDTLTELAQHNLTLQDAHPWNVLWDGCKPLWVDFGSIRPAAQGDTWPAYDEFCQFFLHPLYAMSHGHGRIARCLLRNHSGMLSSEMRALTCSTSLGRQAREAIARLVTSTRQRIPSPAHPLLRKGLDAYRSVASRLALTTHETQISLATRLRQEVQSIVLPCPTTEWSDYGTTNFPSFSPSEAWTTKHRTIHTVLSTTRPTSLLDFGSNRGWYSQFAALLGIPVVAFDIDEPSLTKLYHAAKKADLSILPLLMDFRFPSSAFGPYPSAAERLACDMVIALALTHHLVFKRKLDFGQIVDGLSAFSKKWLLVEFVPDSDRHVRQWWSESFSWYTLDNFVHALRKTYRTVDVLPSYPDPRVLLLCER